MLKGPRDQRVLDVRFARHDVGQNLGLEGLGGVEDLGIAEVRLCKGCL